MRLIWFLTLLPALLAGCDTLPIPTTIPPVPQVEYTAWHPFYFEFCALSEQNKKPGFGVELRGGIGGHSTIYINGVCLKNPGGYPELQICQDHPGSNGVGISVNSHFINAAWVGVPGHDFFYHGDLLPGQELTHEVYNETKAHAARLGLYNAIRFHDEAYEDMPKGFDRETFKYEVSIATDYALGYGRDRYCARVPVTEAQLQKIVDFMNGLNRPYRDGKAVFEWNVFNNNCIHVAHNALAAIGFWPEWPTGMPVILAAFDFPVPKNEFVNIARRANDMKIGNLMSIWRDRSARQALLAGEGLPTRPGALVTFEPMAQDNSVYDLHPELIFYDDPVLGSYEDWYREIAREPRYTNLQADLDAFQTRSEQIESEKKPLEWWLQQHPSLRSETQFPEFYQRYYNAIEQQAADEGSASTLFARKED
jgi:hypothetical protein